MEKITGGASAGPTLLRLTQYICYRGDGRFVLSRGEFNLKTVDLLLSSMLRWIRVLASFGN